MNGLHAIQSNANITVDSNSTWKSPSGDFEFGFYPLPTALFLVGIWFGRIPEKTLAWYYQSPPVELNSQVQFTYAKNLVVAYPIGTIAQTAYSGSGATSDHMQDDENFVMNDSNLESVWKSFNSLANIMLPGQTLQITKVLYSKARGASIQTTLIGKFHVTDARRWQLGAKSVSMVIPCILVHFNHDPQCEFGV